MLGLTDAEARRRLAASGPNEPAPSRRDSPLREILPSLANPLVVILTPLPGSFFLFLAAVTVTSLLVVEAVKRRLFARRGLSVS